MTTENSFPIVTLRLQGMQYSIRQALVNHLVDVQAAAELAVERAVEHFDFAAEAEAATSKVLAEQLQSAIRGAVFELFRRASVQSAIREAVVGAIREGCPVAAEAAEAEAHD